MGTFENVTERRYCSFFILISLIIMVLKYLVKISLQVAKFIAF